MTRFLRKMFVFFSLGFRIILQRSCSYTVPIYTAQPVAVLSLDKIVLSKKLLKQVERDPAVSWKNSNVISDRVCSYKYTHVLCMYVTRPHLYSMKHS